MSTVIQSKHLSIFMMSVASCSWWSVESDWEKEKLNTILYAVYWQIMRMCANDSNSCFSALRSHMMASLSSTGRKSNCAAASQCLSVVPQPPGQYLSRRDLGVWFQSQSCMCRVEPNCILLVPLDSSHQIMHLPQRVFTFHVLRAKVSLQRSITTKPLPPLAYAQQVLHWSLPFDLQDPWLWNVLLACFASSR